MIAKIIVLYVSYVIDLDTIIIALTGEKVIPDIASWQSMVDQTHSQTEQFLIHIDSMSTTLQKMEGEFKVSLSIIIILNPALLILFDT